MVDLGGGSMMDLALASLGLGLVAAGIAVARTGCPATPSAGVTYTPGSVELSPAAFTEARGRTFPGLVSAGPGSIVGREAALVHAHGSNL